jgi:hypothetical protein
VRQVKKTCSHELKTKTAGNEMGPEYLLEVPLDNLPSPPETGEGFKIVYHQGKNDFRALFCILCSPMTFILRMTLGK